LKEARWFTPADFGKRGRERDQILATARKLLDLAVSISKSNLFRTQSGA
jgi:hypothetical protein